MGSWAEQPVSRIERPGKEPLEVARCQADGALVTMSRASLSRHVGHKVKQPVILTEEEKAAIMAGEIE